MRNIAARLVLIALVAGLWMPAARATAANLDDDFRVESKVFLGNEKEPKSLSTTIFFHGVVYDFLQKPSEIIVFDPGRGRFILLDPARKVRAEVTTHEVLAINDNLRRWAGTQSDNFIKFVGDPKFEQASETGEIIFESPWVTYRVTPAESESEAVAEQYRGFSDWCARLNTRLNPGYMLALAQLEVNAALRERRQIPQSVTLTVISKKGLLSQKTVLRSEHQLIRRLVESDRDRVTQTSEFLAIFQPVTFEEYQKRSEP